MKKSLSLLLILLGMAAGLSTTFGQSITPPPTRASTPPLQFGNPSLDTMECRYFQVSLKLTPVQTSAVLQAIEARNGQLRTLNAQSISVTQRAVQLKPIVSGFSGRLSKILTPDQLQKWTLLSQKKLDSVTGLYQSQHKSYSTLN